MAIARTPSVTPLARPVDLSAAWNASDARVAARLHPIYGPGLARLPDGPVVFRGVPFELGVRASGPRWILLDGELEIDLRGAGAASHVVIAHFSDSWRDAAGDRPPGTPVGWVVPAGETLARYDIRLADGTARSVTVRRRFEIADGIIGWGFLPFAAIGHRADESLEWRGPHERLGRGRYAPAGHAGPLTMLPGSWGVAQTGVADFVPTANDEITYWLHVIPLGGRLEAESLRLVGLGNDRPGTDVVIAAVTLFDGTADPLVADPRRQILVRGAGDELPTVDLGVAIRTRPLHRATEIATTAAPSPLGWGRARDEAGIRSDDGGEESASIVDLALAPDARIGFGTWQVAAADLARSIASPDGRISVEPLGAADIRVEVRILADGEPAPSRVRFVAADGRYLPPLGHRDEINPGLLEDTGAGLILGRDTYAYVPGQFRIDLPQGAVEVEVVKGFDHAPVRRALAVNPTTSEIEIALDRAIDLRAAGWRSSDSHVHFLAPSTALLQAAAEDINWVHVLATQLGDAFTSVTDLTWGAQRDASGEHAVIMGTENRQNMLGHLALLGARRPVMPLASGGAPEGRIGAATTELLADWAAACRADGGLAVAAHFPLPFAEIAADIVAGLIDAIELQVFAPGLDNPSISEWYRFLNCGYRLPVLGGTDKMSAEVPVGAVRTYARLDPEVAPTFEAWSEAVRAGRTFATSGPVIQLSVEGREPGSVIDLPPSGGHLEVHAHAQAAQRVIGALELVVNGQVVASESAPAGADELDLVTSIAVDAGSWIAARSRSDHEIHSAFSTSMAAHSSPVYVDVLDRPLFVEPDAEAILQVIDGTTQWLERIATIGDADSRARMAGRIAKSAAILRERTTSSRSGGSPR